MQKRFLKYRFMWLFVADPDDTTTTGAAVSRSVDLTSTTTTASSRPAAASDPSGVTTTASGVDSSTTTTTATTQFLSRNYTYLGKEVPDGTPLNTSPGFTWKQYQIFCNMWENKDGPSLCHLCNKAEIKSIANAEQIGGMEGMEYMIVGDSVVPAFKALSNTSVSKKREIKIQNLSFDHHSFGMTEGETDVSKAMLCSMICDNCNIRLGNIEKRLREGGTLKDFDSVLNQEHIKEVENYIKEKEILQCIINKWHEGIEDKDELCVDSCHSARTLLSKHRTYLRNIIAEQLERLKMKGVETKRRRRGIKTQSWIGSTKGM